MAAVSQVEQDLDQAETPPGGAAEVELLSDDPRLFSGYFWQIQANPGYFLATVWLILANPGYSWQILAIFWLILGNSG